MKNNIRKWSLIIYTSFILALNTGLSSSIAMFANSTIFYTFIIKKALLNYL